jgi:glycosyltransferase involved in cell wall biosynthesis
MLIDNTKKIRILIIHPGLPPYRLNLFNAIALRCQLRLVFLYKNCLGQMYDQSALEKQLRAEYGHLARGFTILQRRFRFGVEREISRFQPDFVVTQEFSPVTLSVTLFSLYRKRTFRHIVWTDDNTESIHRDSIIRRLLRRLVLPCVDGLVCLTEEAASLYRTRFGATMPIGISLILHEETVFRDALVQATPVAQKLVEEYQLEGKRILLFIGRLATVKRIDRLLLAFSQIHDVFGTACLVLIGDGPQREPLQKFVQELGVAEHVIFAGRAEGDQLYAWYRLGGVFVLASEFEPYGAVVNEALLAGMPVVCSSKAGARVLIEEGVNGTVVDASDPASLKSVICDWLERTAPFTTAHLEQMRFSLMATTFQNSVDGFLSVVATPRENGALF